jgi:tetratricopeptide (TPR) repeat protein
VIALAVLGLGSIEEARALPEGSRRPQYVSPRAYYQTMLAERSREAGDVQGSIAAYELALVYDPDSYHLHIALAGLLVGQREESRAAKLVQHALELAPKRPEAHRLRARVLLAAGQREEAERALREAMAVAPREADAATDLVALLRREGRIPEALRVIERTSALPKGGDALLDWAFLEAEQEHEPKAIAILDDARAPTFRSRAASALLNDRAGKIDRARQSWRELVQERPADPRCVQEAERFELTAGRPERAAAYRSMLPPRVDRENHLAAAEAAEVALDLGDPIAARALVAGARPAGAGSSSGGELLRALAEREGSPAALGGAVADAGAGAPDRAEGSAGLDALQRAVELEPTDAAALAALASALSGAGKSAAAAALAERAVRLAHLAALRARLDAIAPPERSLIPPLESAAVPGPEERARLRALRAAIAARPAPRPMPGPTTIGAAKAAAQGVR